MLLCGKKLLSNESMNPPSSVSVWLQPHNLVLSNREFCMLSVRRSTDVKRTANKHQKAGTTPDREKDLQTSTQGSITARVHIKTAHFLHLLMRLISDAWGCFPAGWCVQELIRAVIYDWPWIMALCAQPDWPGEERHWGGMAERQMG